MVNKNLILVTLFLVIFSCTPQRRLQSERRGEILDFNTYCDSLKSFKSLYINKIDAKISFDKEDYDARVSVYYVPDSIFFVSAVNSGFEIVRIAITNDSIVYINRLDKLVYIFKTSEFGAPPPLDFDDLELLVNKNKLCNAKVKRVGEKNELIIDLSKQDIGKEIRYSKVDFSLQKFEFFQKKTSEYVVGERSGENDFVIYSNYLMGDLIFQTTGGVIQYDKDLNIDLSVNRNKYDIVYF
jgi:hypothetical protein